MKNILYIGNKLSKHGNTLTSIETMGELLEKEGYNVFYASSKKNKAVRFLDMIVTTLRYCLNVDFVLIDVYSTQNFWFAFVISQLCRVLHLKYIPKLHGGNLPERFTNNPKLCRMIFDNAHVNVAPSDYLLSAFNESGFKNIVHIPNTIEINKYKFCKRNNVKPNLLWVRSFAEIYNPMMALDVLQELLKSFPEANLCMVGPDKDGSLEKIKNAAETMQLPVTFTGKLKKKQWAKLSENYDVFINTTHFDNTPISVIEAMSLGLAVVTTNVGGIPYLLENNEEAILVNDAAVDEMTKAIEKLLKDFAFFKSITANARAKAEGFDWNCVKNKWFAVLQ